MRNSRSTRGVWQQPVDCLTHRSVRVPVVAPPVKHAASAAPSGAPEPQRPGLRLGARTESRSAFALGVLFSTFTVQKCVQFWWCATFRRRSHRHACVRVTVRSRTTNRACPFLIRRRPAFYHPSGPGFFMKSGEKGEVATGSRARTSGRCG